MEKGVAMGPRLSSTRCAGTPRSASAIRPWSGPVRNVDWIASVIGHG